MSRLSSKIYNPRATGSLHHFMLKLFCAVLKTAPFSVNSSTFLPIIGVSCCLQVSSGLKQVQICIWTIRGTFFAISFTKTNYCGIFENVADLTLFLRASLKPAKKGTDWVKLLALASKTCFNSAFPFWLRSCLNATSLEKDRFKTTVIYIT